MRRKDREVTSKEELTEILQACKVCRIAMATNNKPYIVPMNFGYVWQNDLLVLYFHCAKEGKKIDMLTENNSVCFEMDGRHDLVTGTTACDYSFAYSSIIGNGKATFLEDPVEKEAALMHIMQHQTEKSEFTFSETILKHTQLFQIISSDYSGKINKK